MENLCINNFSHFSLQEEYMSDAEALKLKIATPGLAFLHIPPREFNYSFD